MFFLVYPSHLSADHAMYELVGIVASHECHINMAPAIQGVSAQSHVSRATLEIMSKLVSLLSGPETCAHWTDRPIIAFHAHDRDLLWIV
jgi:hypothetical protein